MARAAKLRTQNNTAVRFLSDTPSWVPLTGQGEGLEATTDEVVAQAPDQPELRLAWAQGFGHVNVLQAAVDFARSQGLTWAQIGESLGEHPGTARTKYGGGLERMRRYRARKRGDE